MKIYRGSTANEVTSRPVTVSAGTTATFIIGFPDAIPSGSNPAWVVSLRGLEINGSLQVSPFTNVGTFPITDRK